MRIYTALFVMAAGSVPLGASPIINLSFEGLADSEPVAGFYNGGQGGLGGGPGVNYGVAFSSDATVFIQVNQSMGNIIDTGLFGGEPSPYTAMLFCDACATDQTSQTINVAAGFDSAFSLYYSAPFSVEEPGQLVIWSGVNGTGANLGSLTLPGTVSDPNCETYGNASDPGVPACPFFHVSMAFAGIAKSVVFSGTNNVMYFDDITFGTTVPEPTTWLLLATGLAFSRRIRGLCS